MYAFLTEITAAFIYEGLRLSNIHNYYPITAVGVYFRVYNPPHLFKQSVLMREVKNRTEISLLLLNDDVFDVKIMNREKKTKAVNDPFKKCLL